MVQGGAYACRNVSSSPPGMTATQCPSCQEYRRKGEGTRIVRNDEEMESYHFIYDDLLQLMEKLSEASASSLVEGGSI